MKKNRHNSVCHIGPVEVVKNLYCGSEDESLDMASAPIKVDTLIPLNSMDASIWRSGFRGEVLYYPIDDYGVLPSDVLEDLVQKALGRLSRDKKVGLFCMGGHGRTGYVASAILGRMGYDDPIRFLRANYCRNAVESGAQVKHIASFLGKPELAAKYKTCMNRFDVFADCWADYYELLDCESDDLSAFDGNSAEQDRCGDCVRFDTENCISSKYSLIDLDDLACDTFVKAR